MIYAGLGSERLEITFAALKGANTFFIETKSPYSIEVIDYTKDKLKVFKKRYEGSSETIEDSFEIKKTDAESAIDTIMTKYNLFLKHNWGYKDNMIELISKLM